MASTDPVMQTCASYCSPGLKILDPCGGVSDPTKNFQQNLTFTVSPNMAACECNSDFYNAFSSCLSCIASQAKSNPDIQNQQDWVRDCKAAGYEFTPSPVKPLPGAPGTSGSTGGGLSTGALIGIIVGSLVVVALVGAFLFLKNRRKRTKASIFERPYTSASSGTGGTYVQTPTNPTFNTHSNYHNAEYPHTQEDYGDYNQHDAHNDQYYDYQNQHQDNMMMQNMNTYVPPPAPLSPTSTAVLGSPRPSDSLPQSLRNKKGWNDQPHDLTSDLVSGDQLLHNDKTEFEDGDELEPPRSRDRFVNDRDDFTSRRSLTPPRTGMRSYGDDFSRPSFEREPRHSGSDRGSISGLNMVRGTASGGYGSGSEDFQDNSESAQRRARAAELFSAEGTRR